MRLILLIVSTALVVFYFIMAVRGNKYSSYTDALEGSDYPLKELYGFGFALQDIKLFSLKGSVYLKLTNQAKMLYEPMYTEFYAKVVWAQTLTFIFLSVIAGFVLAAMLDSAFFVLVGIIVAAVFGYYFFNSMKTKLDERHDAAGLELPEIVSSMALLMNAGLVVNEAWKKVAYSSDSEIYNLMKTVSDDVDNGVPFKTALNKFGNNANSQEVKKFSSALAQSLDKGNKDLCDFLTHQSSEMLIIKKQHMLQKGEEAASKLLAPIGIIFVGVIVIVLAAVVGMFTGSGSSLI